MVVHSVLVALAALGAASCFAWSNVLEQRIAAKAPPETSLRPSLLWHLAHHPLWWLGIGIDTAGFVLQLVALGIGELVFVQPLLVTSLVLSLTFGMMVGSNRLIRSDLGWAAVFVAALALFLVVGNPSGGVAVAPFGTWAPALIIIAVLVGVCVAVSLRATRRALALAAGAGMAFGVSSALMKGLAQQISDDGVGLFANWHVYVLAVALATGFLLMQSAFQAGDLRSALPAVELGEPVVASLLGVAVLGEHLQVDNVAQAAALALAILVMGVGALRLAQSTAEFKAPARRTPRMAKVASGTGTDAAEDVSPHSTRTDLPRGRVDHILEREGP